MSVLSCMLMQLFKYLKFLFFRFNHYVLSAENHKVDFVILSYNISGVYE